MTGDTLNFLYLRAHQGGGASFGGGKGGCILGIGGIGKFADNSINKVHYVEGLKYNLLTILKSVIKGMKSSSWLTNIWLRIV